MESDLLSADRETDRSIIDEVTAQRSCSDRMIPPVSIRGVYDGPAGWRGRKLAEHRSEEH